MQGETLKYYLITSARIIQLSMNKFLLEAIYIYVFSKYCFVWLSFYICGLVPIIL